MDYNKMFEDFFEKNYDGDIEKKEIARVVFNELMKALDDKNILMDSEIDDISDMNLDKVGIHFAEGGAEGINNLKDKLKLKVSEIDAYLTDDVIIITEKLHDDNKTYYMEEKYALTKPFFEKNIKANYELCVLIIEKLLDKNLLNKTHMEYIELLKRDDIKRVLNGLMQNAIKTEAYEDAGVYRNKKKWELVPLF